MGCKHYNDLRYADDTALLAWNEKELSEFTSNINEVGKQFRMKAKLVTCRGTTPSQTKPASFVVQTEYNTSADMAKVVMYDLERRSVPLSLSA